MRFNKNIVLYPLPLLAVGSVTSSCTSQKPNCEKPNIVFLLFDDAGYGDWGCYGQQKIETPNIDALAENGVRFIDMYSACPLSSPSRCAIMTGKHMGHAWIRNNANINFEKASEEELEQYGVNAVFLNHDYQGQAGLNDTEHTLAQMFKNNGYATAMVGKYGLGTPNSDSTPDKIGIDYFYGFNCQALAHSYYPTHLWENNEEIATGNDLIVPGCKFPENLDPRDPKNYECYSGKFYSPDLMFDKITNFVDKNAKNPFLLFWTTTVPHSCVQAPAEEVQHYVDKLGDEEPVTNPGVYLPNRYPHATYAAMITHIDTQLGKLVAQLKELGIYDNTIIVVTSDNGPAHNANSPLEYFQSGGPFRCRDGWGKRSLHEGGVRMPFVVSWNNHIKPAVSNHIGCFTDILPTFADLIGTTAFENDGISFAPTLLSIGEQQQHPYLYWEYPDTGGWLGIRWGKWKGICKKVNSGNNCFELYDLETDPQELIDVAKDHQDIVDKMWGYVKTEHRPSEAPFSAKYEFDTKIVFPK